MQNSDIKQEQKLLYIIKSV